MMMNPLSFHYGHDRLSVFTIHTLDVANEFGLLSVQSSLDLVDIVMLKGTVLYREDVELAS